MKEWLISTLSDKDKVVKILSFLNKLFQLLEKIQDIPNDCQDSYCLMLGQAPITLHLTQDEV